MMMVDGTKGPGDDAPEGQGRGELDQILNAIPAGIIVLAGSGAIDYANDTAARVCGFPSFAAMKPATMGEIAGRFRMWDEEGGPLLPEELPSLQALSGRTSERVLRYRPRDAAEGDRWLLVRATPIRDAEARVARVVIVFRDVTERRRAEKWQGFFGAAGAILGSSTTPEALFQGVADLAARAVADWCAIDLRHPDGSSRRVALSHSDPARLALAQGRGAGAFARVAKPQLVAQATDEALVQGEGEPLGIESAVAVPLGTRGAMTGTVTLATAGRLPRYGADDLAAAEDLARRISVSMDNVRLFNETQKALRAREDFLAIVSHDLRNPLGVVMASTALLLKSPLPPDKQDRARRQVEAIQRAGHRMNLLIRDLLDFASIQSGQLALTPRAHPVGKLVGETVEMLAPQAAHKSLRIDNQIAGGEWSGAGTTAEGAAPGGVLPTGDLVLCDHDRMIQVFANILGNAIKFTPEGGRVTVSAAREGDRIHVCFADTGPGIAPDELPHVFDRSFQASRKNRDGIGLGLSIAKGIVDAHGGGIWVESVEGQGSRFFIALPSGRDDASAARLGR